MQESSTDIITYTQDIWEPRLGYRPTKGEAEEMIRNVTALFKLLMEWDAEEKKKAENQELDGQYNIIQEMAG